MTIQPVYSMICTAAQVATLTASDFNAASPYYARISNVLFISSIEVIYKHSSSGPHYLEISADQAKTAIAVPTDKPLWTMPVWPINQNAPASHYPPDEHFRAWQQPIASSQIDLYFCSDVYPNNARWFKPSSDILVHVTYYPSK